MRMEGWNEDGSVVGRRMEGWKKTEKLCMCRSEVLHGMNQKV